MRDGQYRLLWTGISDSKKMKAISGEKVFRIGCHLVYTWLLPWCDDDGRMPGEPLKILANVAPNEDFSLKEIEKILVELTRVGLIIWYEIYPNDNQTTTKCQPGSQNEKFIQVLDWDKYQHIRKDRYKSSIYTPYQPSDNQEETNGCQPAHLISSPSPSPSLIEEKSSRLCASTPDFISQLKEIYAWIDVDTEIQKMKGFLLTPKGKGRKLTHAFAVRWLNRVDKPIEEKKHLKPKVPKPKYQCDICGELHEVGTECPKPQGEQVS